MKIVKLAFVLCIISFTHAYVSFFSVFQTINFNFQPTNVVQSCIWSSKLVDFAIVCEDNERTMFSKLIYDTVTELNTAVGSKLIEWNEYSYQAATYKPRYLVFILERFKCGHTIASDKGGFFVPLSISPRCSNATNLRNLMGGLGKYNICVFFTLAPLKISVFFPSFSISFLCKLFYHTKIFFFLHAFSHFLFLFRIYVHTFTKRP